MMHPWEIIRQFLQKPNVYLPYNPAVTLLGIYPIEIKKIYKNPYKAFTVILLSTPKEKAVGCSSTYEQQTPDQTFNAPHLSNEEE